MNVETESAPLKGRPSNILIISLIVFILLVLAVTAQITYALLSRDKVYRGVYIEDLHVGNMTREELSALLNEKYQLTTKDISIELKLPKAATTFNLSDVHAVYNIEETVDNAFQVGRTGNIFNRLYSIYKTGKNPVRLDMSITYDSQKLEAIIQDFYQKNFIPVKEADLLIQGERVSIRSGHHGESFDKSAVLSKAHALITAREGGSIEIEMIHTKPLGLNVDDIYANIVIEPVNALPVAENNKVEILPHKKGRKIDKQVLADILSEVEKTENTERILPVEFVLPEITMDKASSMILRDKLATFSTKFDTSTQTSANRGENIKLAVSTINGKILAPGEEFSFNGVVGPRSAEGGYKEAPIYVGGRLDNGIGGGICQVSSTLYNSVLRANLEVVERRNHSLTVGYVPKGCDATVSYGTVDFKFKNSTRWPIKITGEVTKDNRIIFTLTGTNENPGRTIEIVSETISETPYKKIYKDDPSLVEGKTKILQEGKNGYVVDTYKITKQDGKVIGETKLHTSRYAVLDEIILRGTKKVPATATPIPTPAPTPSSSPVPSQAPVPTVQP